VVPYLLKPDPPPILAHTQGEKREKKALFQKTWRKLTREKGKEGFHPWNEEETGKGQKNLKGSPMRSCSRVSPPVSAIKKSTIRITERKRKLHVKLSLLIDKVSSGNPKKVKDVVGSFLRKKSRGSSILLNSKEGPIVQAPIRSLKASEKGRKNNLYR